MTEFENIAPPTGKLFPDAPASIKHDYEYEEFKASQALEGIPSSQIAGKMRAYEDLFQKAMLEEPPFLCSGDGVEYTSENGTDFFDEFVPIEGWVWPAIKSLFKTGRVDYKTFVRKPSGVKLSRVRSIELTADLLRILRMEIKELALAYAKELNDKQALTIQADLGRQLIKTQAQQQKFRQFLKEHFEADLERATALNKPLLELAAEILMRTK